MSLATKTHICTESPCPIEDRELTERFINSSGTIYAKTPLEQFNEEVVKKFDDYIEKSEIINSNFIKKFITQKLTEHKALILKMVRERAPEIVSTDARNFDDRLIYEGFNKGVQEFLNNLDTI